MPNNTPKFEKIKSWLNEFSQEKIAAKKLNKSGESHLEPKGRGKTTHPSKDVDDHTEEATTGPRAAENESDIKKMEPPGNIDSAKDTGPSQEELNYNIGLRQSATGEDPSVEDDFGSRPKDPGTSFEANANEIGDKYGEWVKKEANTLKSMANEILADYAVGITGDTKTANSSNTTSKTAQTNNTQANNTQLSEAPITIESMLGLTKESADAVSNNIVAQLVKYAEDRADCVGSFLVSAYSTADKLAAQKKKAEGMPPEAMAGGAGGPPPGGPSGGGVPPEALAAMAGGAGGDPSGGASPEAAMGGGEPGKGGGEEAALQELAMALMELGISPEELAAAISQAGAGGAGGGAPPEAAGAGGPPPGGPSPEELGTKVASDVKKFMRSGRFEVTAAKTAAQRRQRDELKSYIKELVGV